MPWMALSFPLDQFPSRAVSLVGSLDVIIFVRCMHMDVDLSHTDPISNRDCSPHSSRIPPSNMAVTSHMWLQIFKFELVNSIKLKI